MEGHANAARSPLLHLSRGYVQGSTVEIKNEAIGTGQSQNPGRRQLASHQADSNSLPGIRHDDGGKPAALRLRTHRCKHDDDGQRTTNNLSQGGHGSAPEKVGRL